MLKKMIQRCPNCGQWLETGRAGIIGRAFSGWVDGCVACGDVGSKIGEKVGYKNIGAFLGGAFGSYISIFDGIDNAISGEHYQFECVSCGAKWSTDDENDDQTALYEKWEKEVAQLKKVKEKWQSAESHEDYTKVYRLIKQYLKTFTDDQLIASLSDYAALCLWFKNGSIDDALEMITNSLNIFDYNEGHAIKGLILSDKEELTPLESYSGMVEISKLLCDPEPQISYLELNTYKVKFNELANIYQNQIQHIPADDRKYITSVY